MFSSNLVHNIPTSFSRCDATRFLREQFFSTLPVFLEKIKFFVAFLFLLFWSIYLLSGYFYTITRNWKREKNYYLSIVKIFGIYYISISFIIINSNFLSIIRLLVDNQEINQLDHMLVSFVSYLESKNKIYLSNHQLTLKSKWQTIKNIDWFLFLL